MEENIETKDPVVEEPSTEPIENSILNDIKSMLGPTYDDDSFDTDIIIYINSIFTILRQLGIGPTTGYRIKDKKNIWSEFIKDEEMLDAVKTYIYLKVKLTFDPPLNASLVESFTNQAKELEWRLNVSVESDPIGGENNGNE